MRVMPDRGLDIGAVWLAGSPVAWLSPVGETTWSGGDWLSAWAGGLLATCGLRNVGAPSEGHPVPGTATALPASDVRVSRVVEPDGVVAVTVAGTLDDASAFGPVLQLHRTITVRTGRAELALFDVTANVRHRTEHAPILYHVHFGFPFLDPQAFVDGRLSGRGREIPTRTALGRPGR